VTSAGRREDAGRRATLDEAIVVLRVLAEAHALPRALLVVLVARGGRQLLAELLDAGATIVAARLRLLEVLGLVLILHLVVLGQLDRQRARIFLLALVQLVLVMGAGRGEVDRLVADRSATGAFLALRR
jgi:hypothetical protein